MEILSHTSSTTKVDPSLEQSPRPANAIVIQYLFDFSTVSIKSQYRLSQRQSVTTSNENRFAKQNDEPIQTLVYETSHIPHQPPYVSEL